MSSLELGCTWPGGAYDGATEDGKHALLTRPPRSPFRYRIGSGGADGALDRGTGAVQSRGSTRPVQLLHLWAVWYSSERWPGPLKARTGLR